MAVLIAIELSVTDISHEDVEVVNGHIDRSMIACTVNKL
jgi:hypothetical protein